MQCLSVLIGSTIVKVCLNIAILLAWSKMNEQPANETGIPAQDGVRASKAEQAAALAETRLAELDASDEPSRWRRWQFGLGPLLVL